MGDLRQYRFGDWFYIFLKAWPAFLLVQLLIALPFAVLVALFQFMPSAPK
jgi:hypothetical protein